MSNKAVRERTGIRSLEDVLQKSKLE